VAIPEEFLEELVARNELVDLVSGYVNLQRKGGRYWGCCPFHNEKTPSFSVNAERQQYYCFGCHKGGGVINFIMEVENLPFLDAVQVLADKAGMTVPEQEHKGSGQGQQHRKRLLELNKEAARYFHSQLLTPAGAPMLQYLQQRKLSKRTITNFGLGAAPEGWDNLIRAMAEKGYDKGELLECGLAIKSEKGRIYDRFRNRVMFPIIDVRGSVIGFGGRVLDDSTPKYLNSPDTVIYNKSKNLFALNIAKRTKRPNLILTEGYMDTIALHQAGFDNAVASLGTSLTEDHAQLLSHYTKAVVLSYDGDGAGIKAAQRAIGILEKTGLDVKVLQVTGAKDPDEFVKKYGPEAFERLINQSGGQMEYRLRQLKGQFNLESDDDRVKYLREAATLVAELSSPVEREVYANRVAQDVGLSPTAMNQEVERARNQRARKAKKQEQRASLNPAASNQPKERALRYQNLNSALAEEGVLSLMALDSSLFQEAEGKLNPEDFTSPFLGKVYGLFRQRWQEGRQIRVAAMAGELTQEEMNQLTAALQKPVSPGNVHEALRDYIDAIQLAKLRAGGESDDRILLAFRDKKANGGNHL
jgi:DNA primase